MGSSGGSSRPLRLDRPRAGSRARLALASRDAPADSSNLPTALAEAAQWHLDFRDLRSLPACLRCRAMKTARSTLPLFLALLSACATTGPTRSDAPATPAPAADKPPAIQSAATAAFVEAALVKGCTSQADQSTTTLDCGDVSFVVSQIRTDAADDPHMREFALKTTLGELRNNGMTTAAHRPHATGVPSANAVDFDFSLSDETGAVEQGHGMMLVRTLDARQVTTILCLSQAATAGALDCFRGVTYLATAGIPAPLAKQAPVVEARFAGRALAIPEGCSSNSGEELVCERVNLVWEHLPAQGAEAAADAFVKKMLEQLEGMVPVKPVRAPAQCKLDGAAARCEKFTWSEKGATFSEMVSAYAEVRGQPVVALCTWATAAVRRPGLPQACSALISLER